MNLFYSIHFLVKIQSLFIVFSLKWGNAAKTIKNQLGTPTASIKNQQVQPGIHKASIKSQQVQLGTQTA